jgi:hypothetical protein
MQVTWVPTEHVEFVWPNIREFMMGAAEFTFGRFTAEDIKNELLRRQGEQQLWVAFEDKDNFYGAVVTEVYQYPQMRALIMHFTGGKQLPKWKTPMLKILQQFAADNECDAIESYGRPGWAKVFKKDGYEQRFIFYELPVE